MGGFGLYRRVKAGTVSAALTMHRASFCLRDALGPRVAVTTGGLSLSTFSRHFRARARPADSPSALYPHAVTTPAAAWRTLIGKFRSGHFFPEAEAQRQTLGPRLPHHRRHPLTADEALAGIVLAIMLVGAIVFAIARLI